MLVVVLQCVCTFLLQKLWKEIDNYFSSKELKIKLFGDKLDKYEYQPLIRYPDETD